MSEVYVVKSTSQVISGFPVGSILYVSRRLTKYILSDYGIKDGFDYSLTT